MRNFLFTLLSRLYLLTLGLKKLGRSQAPGVAQSRAVYKRPNKTINVHSCTHIL